MQIKFLGTGVAFEPHLGTSAVIVEHEDVRVLVDCGYTVFPTLLQRDVADKVDYILITHLHGDHIGSLPTYLNYISHILKQEAQIIVPTEAFQAELHAFFHATWAEKHVHYLSISDFPWIGSIDTFGQHVEGRQSFAYYFTDGEELIYYSGDLANVDTTVDFLKTRSEPNIRVFHDVNKTDSPVHVFYKEAEAKLAGYDVYGYHCDKATMPADCKLKLVEEYPELLA